MLSMISGLRRSRHLYAVYDFEIQAKRSLRGFCSSGFRRPRPFHAIYELGIQAKRSLHVVYDLGIQAIAPSAVRISGERALSMLSMILGSRRSRHLHAIYDFGIQAIAPFPYCL
jgi:phenylacetate-coenzyme A ligase PaaK-like adenylate-forming protein